MQHRMLHKIRYFDRGSFALYYVNMPEKYNPFKDPNQSLEKIRENLEIKTPAELEEAKREAGFVKWPEHLERLLESEDPLLKEYADKHIKLKTPDNSPRIFLPLKLMAPNAHPTSRDKQIIKILQKSLEENRRLSSNKEIAEELGLEEGTVKTYLAATKKRIGFLSRLDLALLNLETAGDSKGSNEISIRLIPVPSRAHLTPGEISIIRQLRDVVLTRDASSLHEKLAREKKLSGGTYRSYISELLSKTGLESWVQLAFLDLDSQAK